MRRKSGWLWGLVAVAMLAVAASATAEVRTWTDSTGKHKFDAELLSTKDGKVRLRGADGKEVSVPLDRLSDADREFVNSRSAGGTIPGATVPAATKRSATAPSTQTPSAQARSAQARSAATRGANAASQELLEMAEQFFEGLRSKQRDQSRELLTDAAQALTKTGKSALANLPNPDPRPGSIKPGRVKVDGDQAEVPVQVRVAGMSQRTTLHFRRESDQWRVFALSAKVADDEMTINFEEPIGGPAEKKKDPLPELVGQKLDLAGYTIDGRPLDMSKYEGKVVLIDFWATWCGPCRAEIPNILANWQQHHEAGFEVIAISVDRELDDLRKFVAAENPPWTVIADHHPKNRQSMGSKYGIGSIPAFVLLGKDGKVAAVHCRGERLGHEVARLLGTAEAISASK